MLGKGALERQPNQLHNIWRSVLVLMFFVPSSSSISTEILVDPLLATSSSGKSLSLEVDQHPNADRADLVLVAELMPQASRVEGRIRWTTSRILKEVGKQAIDQPGHFLIGGAPIWASRYLVGVPWLGWVAAPILAYREWLQWPSNRWWDPPLDWAFLTLGAVAATRSRRPGHRLSGGLAGIRQSVASALALRGNMHPAS